MEPKFITIEINLNEDTPSRSNVLFSNLPQNIKVSYLKRLVTIEVKAFAINKLDGAKMIITIPKLLQEYLEKEELGSYISELIKRKNISNEIPVVMDEAWSSRLDVSQYNMVSTDYTVKLNMIRLIEEVLERRHYNLQYVELLIVDDGSWWVFYLLDHFCRNLNYVSVLTNKPERFNDFCDELYQQRGMDLIIYRNGQKNDISAHIMILLDDFIPSEVFEISTNGTCIGFNLNKEDIDKVILKRQDLKFYHDIFVKENVPSRFKINYCEILVEAFYPEIIFRAKKGVTTKLDLQALKEQVDDIDLQYLPLSYKGY